MIPISVECVCVCVCVREREKGMISLKQFLYFLLFFFNACLKFCLVVLQRLHSLRQNQYFELGEGPQNFRKNSKKKKKKKTFPFRQPLSIHHLKK